jgi:hypothetical protein
MNQSTAAWRWPVFPLRRETPQYAQGGANDKDFSARSGKLFVLEGRRWLDQFGISGARVRNSERARSRYAWEE